MSINEEEYGLGNSFWELENYKRTVKRVEDGARLCDELIKLIHSRAEIEKKYSSELRTWAKTWNDKIDKGETN